MHGHADVPVLIDIVNTFLGREPAVSSAISVSPAGLGPPRTIWGLGKEISQAAALPGSPHGKGMVLNLQGSYAAGNPQIRAMARRRRSARPLRHLPINDFMRRSVTAFVH
jgi:hypothetical protein